MDQHSHRHHQSHNHSQDHSHDESHDHTHSHDHSHNAHEHPFDHAHDSHGHHHHGIGHSHAPNNKKGLTIALLITAGIMLVEFIGGLVTNSLALLSDSGHMLNDAASLALSLTALWFAARAASPAKSYGFYRFEILAALFNGITLFLIAGFIIWEAYQRFQEPPAVASGSMMAIAAIGLIANLLSAWALLRQSDVKDNLNVRSAYLHILGDALGSVGAMLAGLLMLVFEWYVADPIISVVVALLILRGAWSVMQQTVHILMEGTPASVNMDRVVNRLQAIHGVVEVHDLHVWTISSGRDSLSCHLQIAEEQDSQRILREAVHRIRTEFGIKHATIQVETDDLQHGECAFGCGSHSGYRIP